jgi:lysine 6-dehydrogenase
MRVIALGGGGAMGAVGARMAARTPGVTELVIADRDPASARTVAQGLADAVARPGGGPAVSTATIDVTDAAALRELIRGTDAVLNTTGPFFALGARVLRAAIDAGAHYLDICDDPEPTTELLALDAEARAAGVTAVVGAGASPGISNLLAALAAARLDGLVDLYTAWPVDVGGEADHEAADGAELVLAADGGPSAAAVHWMHQITRPVSVIEAGELVRGEPLRPVALALPGGLRGTAYVVGHPEPVTFHRTLRPGGASACLMVVTARTVAYLDLLRQDVEAGRITVEEAAADLARPTLRRMTKSGLRARRYQGPGTLPPFFAAATGRREGRRLIVLARYDAASVGMAEATGVPLGLALAQVLDGTARRPGVHPVEAVLDAPRFFADLDRVGVGAGGARPAITEEPTGPATAHRRR